MITMRIAQDQDYKELSRLSLQLGYPCSPEDCRKFFRHLELDPDHIVYVAQSSEDVITGFVHVFKTKRLFLDPFGEIGGLVVDDKFRGKGIGKALLDFSEEWLKEQGCSEMRVRSNVIREEAHQFYLDQGYLINKQQKVFLKEFS